MTAAPAAPEDVLEEVSTLGPPGTPVTTPEVAEGFECTQRTIYNRLESLVDDGSLETKKVGAKSRVWWRPIDGAIQQNGGTSDHRAPVSLRDGQAPSFCSDSEMAERIRKFEWAETSLGPMNEWPPALRIAVDIMLGASEAIGIYWGDKSTLLYNDAAVEQIGKKHPEALGQPARDVFPEAWDELGPIHDRVLAGDGPVRIEEHYLPLERTGEPEDIWWDSTFNPIPTEDGSVGGVFNISFDVTERVQAERELCDLKRKSEAKYRTLFESIDEGFCIIEMLFDEDEQPVDYRFLETNPTFEEITDLPDAEGERMRDLVPDHEDHWFEIYGKVARTGESVRFTERAEHLGDRWYDVYAFRIGDPDEQNVAILFDDITERKQTEDALQEREAELTAELTATRELQDISTELIGEDDVEALAERVLDAAVEIVDADFASVQLYDPDRNDLELVAHRGFTREAEAAWKRVTPEHGTTCGMALRTGERVVVSDVETDDDVGGTEELENYRQTGIRSIQTTPLVSRSGDVLGMFSTHWETPHDPSEPELGRLDVLARQAADLFENQKAADALCESEARIDAFVTATSEVVYRTSPDWSVMYYLDGKDFVVDTEEPRETWLEEYIPPDEEQRVKAAIEKAIETKSAVELEHQVVQADGTRGWTQSRAVPVLDDDGNIIEWFGTSTDITERKETEQKLQQQAELDAFRINLADAIRSLTDPVKVQQEAARVLGEQLNATRANYCEVLSEDGRVIVHSEYLHGDTPTALGEHCLNDFGQHILESLHAGNSVVIDDVRTDPQFTEEQRTSYSKFDIRSLVAAPIIKGGQCRAYVVVNGSTPREWTDTEIEMIEETAERTWAAVERARAEEELHESEARLAAELETLKRLQEVSTQSIEEHDTDALYESVLDTTMDLLDADFGTIQRLGAQAHELDMLSYRGFTAETIAQWDRVDAETASSCGKALQTEERVIVPDVGTSELVEAGEDLEAFTRIGIRSMQSTPLISRSGELLGMISTHWTDTHEPSERDLHLLDVIARQVADLMQQRDAYEAISESEASLERLNAATRELMDAEPTTIADRVAPLVREVLDVEYAALWQYDDQRGDLDESATDVAPDLDGDAVEFPTEITDQAWETFVGTDMDVANDLDVSPDTTSPVRSCALVPLGRHGVVCLGSTGVDTFDERTVDLIETVASTVETAWNRADSEETLARQNEELARLDRLNTLIRSLDQALVGADTREAIDEAVCEQLATSDLYESAWIATYDAETDSLRPQAWAGVDSGYLEDRGVAIGDASSDDPLVAAHRTQEMQVVSDIAVDARASGWREAALERGARSCIKIPLVYGESMYGILTVYGQTPQPDEREMDVLGELSGTIAHAIHALEATTTRRTDSVVELTLRTMKADTPLVRLARELDCVIEFEGLVPRADTSTTVFFTTRDVSPEEVVAADEQLLAIEELSHVADRETGALFKARLDDATLPERFLEQNAMIQSLRIDAETVTAVVELAETADIREFIESLERDVPDLDLLSRQTRTREPEATLQSTVLDRLTPRQQEVLQLAYRSGYFEMPRIQSGKELADVLDIVPSTFTKHIRNAERTVLDVIFTDEHGPRELEAK